MPKELLPLGEWPLIHHALLEVERAGFREAIVVISPRKRAIRTYFEGDASLERLLEAQGQIEPLARLRAARAVATRLRLRFVEAEGRGLGESVVLASRLLGDELLGVLLPDDVVPAGERYIPRYYIAWMR